MDKHSTWHIPATHTHTHTHTNQFSLIAQIYKKNNHNNNWYNNNILLLYIATLFT